jgi:hypothetical protein
MLQRRELPVGERHVDKEIDSPVSYDLKAFASKRHRLLVRYQARTYS